MLPLDLKASPWVIKEHRSHRSQLKRRRRRPRRKTSKHSRKRSTAFSKVQPNVKLRKS